MDAKKRASTAVVMTDENTRAKLKESVKNAAPAPGAPPQTVAPAPKAAPPTRRPSEGRELGLFRPPACWKKKEDQD